MNLHFMRPVLQPALIVLVLALPRPASAQAACQDALAAMQSAAGSADVSMLLDTWRSVEASSCGPTQVVAARSQTSAFIAQLAQDRLDAGDVPGAEAMIVQAPGVHWAVQALRGDLAAMKGDRAEAAKMYNAAIDTLGDPQQTVQNQELVPVAQQLARLAQENMMLAGSMESSVTRGGGATGVMGMASRGLAIEKAKSQEPETYVDPAKPAPTANAATDPAAAQGYPADYNVVAEAATSMDSVFLPILFDFDSAHLNAAGIKEALPLAAFINANNVTSLVIIGHTDDAGDADYNLELSTRRAEALADFLQSEGVYSQISIIGKGESEPPLYTDASAYSLEELRTIARRVEVAFGY